MPFDATPTNTVADVLRRAKALIDTPEKWSKGVFGPGLCVLGAVYVANGREDVSDTHVPWLVKALGLRNGCQVFEWNDAPETTHADVMAAFDRAIALAEAGEP